MATVFGGLNCTALEKAHLKAEDGTGSLELADTGKGWALSPDDFSSRASLARATWWSEAATLAVTLLYTALLLSDFLADEPGWTSRSWFGEGFCIWRIEGVASSHSLSFFVDVPLGVFLARFNYRNYVACCNEAVRTGFLVLSAVSVFTVLHGCAHLAFHLLGDDVEVMIQAAHPTRAPILVSCAIFFGMAAFLSLGPFVGVLFGVKPQVAAPVHLAVSFGFLWIRLQFAFACVQLIINFWYCIPRLLWLGFNTETEIMHRVDNGYAVNSIGNLLVLPVVFAEAFGCDLFYRALGGHVLYDGALVLWISVNSLLLWMHAQPQKEP